MVHSPEPRWAAGRGRGEEEPLLPKDSGRWDDAGEAVGAVPLGGPAWQPQPAYTSRDHFDDRAAPSASGSDTETASPQLEPVYQKLLPFQLERMGSPQSLPLPAAITGSLRSGRGMWQQPQQALSLPSALQPGKVPQLRLPPTSPTCSLGARATLPPSEAGSHMSPQRRRRNSAPLSLKSQPIDGVCVEEEPDTPTGMRRALSARHTRDVARERMRFLRPYWRRHESVSVMDVYTAFIMSYDLVDTWGDHSMEESLLMLEGTEDEGGGASMGRAYVLFLKSFVGGAVLTLPKAFSEGGLVFTTAATCCVATWNFGCMYLLWQAGSRAHKYTLGDLSRTVGGAFLGGCCDVSLMLTQCSFCATYFVFMRQCFVQAARWFFNCGGPEFEALSWAAGITLVEALMLTPLSMIRRLQKLAVFALMADVLLVLCLTYLFWVDVTIIEGGGAAEPAPLWMGMNPGVAIGTELFAFEGVGMVLPVAACMNNTNDFPKLLLLVGSTLLLLYAGFGAMGATAFGEHTQTTVLVNLNAHDPSSPAPMLLQIAWGLAILITFPIQLAPSAGLLERRFGADGTVAPIVIRVSLVFGLAVLSVVAGPSFNAFLSLAGAFCCLPLAFLYPPLLHLLELRGRGELWSAPAVARDCALLAAGAAVFSYVVFSTFASLGATEPPVPCYAAQ